LIQFRGFALVDVVFVVSYFIGANAKSQHLIFNGVSETDATVLRVRTR